VRCVNVSLHVQHCGSKKKHLNREIEEVWVTSCVCVCVCVCVASFHRDIWQLSTMEVCFGIETPPGAQTFNGSRVQIILIFLWKKPLNEWANNYKPNAIHLITIKPALSSLHYSNTASPSRNTLILIIQIRYAYCIGLLPLTLIRLQTHLVYCLNKRRVSFTHNFVPKLHRRRSARRVKNIIILSTFLK